MEITERDIQKIPQRNLRVPREEFVAVWTLAEEVCESSARVDSSVRYAAGVAVTCRWLATAIVKPPHGQWFQAPGPVTGVVGAYEELIQDEAVKSQTKLLITQRDSGPGTDPAREDALRGVVATFNWSWFRSRTAPPLGVHATGAHPTAATQTGQNV